MINNTKLKSNFNILIVDDDPLIIELIQSFLEMHEMEFNIVTATDTQTANLKIANQDFNLLIVDFLMPGKNGIEFVRNLKKTSRNSKIPVILMSGGLMQLDVLQAIDSGIKDILVKPFTMKQLFEKINLHLKKNPVI